MLCQIISSLVRIKVLHCFYFAFSPLFIWMIYSTLLPLYTNLCFLAMKLLLKMAFVALIFCSCGGNGDVKKRLGEIESYLGVRPYDAIVALHEIGNVELSTQKLKAKHSLLLSMAMEQMYLEQEDLSLPLAALEYYSRKGKNST